MIDIARATEADITTAARILAAVSTCSDGFLPGDMTGGESDIFDIEDPEDCQRVLRYLIEVEGTGSVVRFVVNAAALLDERNKIINTDSDTLKLHPRIEAALAIAAREPLTQGRILAAAVGAELIDHRDLDGKGGSSLPEEYIENVVALARAIEQLVRGQ